MATCLDIITRATRKLNMVQIGATLNSAESSNALTVLQSTYLELVGWGAFGRENDLLAHGDWTVLPNQRVRMVAESGTAKIPDEVPVFPPWWNRSGWGDDAWIYWPVWPTNPSGTGCNCCRAPDDLSVVTVVDPTANVARTFLYDAYVGRWGALDGLLLTSEAPLSRRWQEPLANVLAGNLATDYGQEISPALAKSIQNGLQAMCSRFGGAMRPTRSEFM